MSSWLLIVRLQLRDNAMTNLIATPALSGFMTRASERPVGLLVAQLVAHLRIRFTARRYASPPLCPTEGSLRHDTQKLHGLRQGVTTTTTFIRLLSKTDTTTYVEE